MTRNQYEINVKILADLVAERITRKMVEYRDLTVTTLEASNKEKAATITILMDEVATLKKEVDDYKLLIHGYIVKYQKLRDEEQ
ncbi:MAG: hypothetical protein CEE41_05130 [Hadesarchaea archaeon B3_Hades]|nr:MAG: hypothetical protein CEE41_05130 [Hadesarchaea archaeon B3_Hades]